MADRQNTRAEAKTSARRFRDKFSFEGGLSSQEQLETRMIFPIADCSGDVWRVQIPPFSIGISTAKGVNTELRKTGVE